jgi:hypothetical protein
MWARFIDTKVSFYYSLKHRSSSIDSWDTELELSGHNLYSYVHGKSMTIISHLHPKTDQNSLITLKCTDLRRRKCHRMTMLA